MFSQVLGVNDQGLAVGYYGDSTLSQHGYFYNTNTGTYSFLDDPDAAFSNGVEVTQITGINNSGEITGFYSDANGVFHGFVAIAVPEPSSIALLGIGVASVAVWTAQRAGRPHPGNEIEELHPARSHANGLVTLDPLAGFTRENRRADLALTPISS